MEHYAVCHMTDADLVTSWEHTGRRYVMSADVTDDVRWRAASTEAYMSDLRNLPAILL